ncbi:uncharacterized protein LOC134203970 [Armigeres subalbatus]|uniref:uncharacterized protein LOC134203969 n=1 Tax=Armigeres subalbatus TaxID=124917 RepID=UPI002ED0E870
MEKAVGGRMFTNAVKNQEFELFMYTCLITRMDWGRPKVDPEVCTKRFGQKLDCCGTSTGTYKTLRDRINMLLTFGSWRSCAVLICLVIRLLVIQHPEDEFFKQSNNVGNNLCTDHHCLE